MNGEQQFKRIINGDAKGILPSAARTILGGLSSVYGAVIDDRNSMYSRRAKDSNIVVKIGIPVISVGNITVGGTGKTPMVSYLCSFFLQKGMKPAVVSRGYKAKDNKVSTIVSDGNTVFLTPPDSGDEAYLLAKKLPGCAVVIGRSRVDSAQIAVNQLGADVIIMDDGFQHRKLGRDLDIVLLDATNPFGYEHLLPRGLLREPLSSLNRADLAIITKADQVSPEALLAMEERIRRLAPQLRWVASTHKPKEAILLTHWQEGSGEESEPITAEQPLLAVSAIGNPKSFIRTIQTAGYSVIDELSFGDHYSYTDKDVIVMIEKATLIGAAGIIVTEKDAVKLAHLVEASNTTIPFYVLPIDIEITENEDLLDSALTIFRKDQ